MNLHLFKSFNIKVTSEGGGGEGTTEETEEEEDVDGYLQKK